MCFRQQEELLEFLQETESSSTRDNDILLSDEKSEANCVLTEKVCIYVHCNWCFQVLLKYKCIEWSALPCGRVREFITVTDYSPLESVGKQVSVLLVGSLDCLIPVVFEEGEHKGTSLVHSYCYSCFCITFSSIQLLVITFSAVIGLRECTIEVLLLLTQRFLLSRTAYQCWICCWLPLLTILQRNFCVPLVNVVKVMKNSHPCKGH